MIVVRRLVATTLLFTTTGLVGPGIVWVIWPVSKFAEGASPWLVTFVHDLLILIWPTRMLAVIEVNTGRFLAGAVAVGANMLLFAVLGLLAGGMVQKHRGLSILYLAVVFFLTILALWNAGFSVNYLNFSALAIGLLLYAMPFYMTAHLGS